MWSGTRGCSLNIKTVRNITKRFAARAREGQRAESVITVLKSEVLQGCKIVISTDGGRLRIRAPKRGRKTKKHRRGYTTDWREPKLLIIYVVDDTGRVDKKVMPIIDGTLKGPDALLILLTLYLRSLNLKEVGQILFVADGAPWIWEVVGLMRLLFTLTGQGCLVLELIDFYHAVQHLYAFAELKRQWSRKKRKQWVTKQKKLLKGGESMQVIEQLKAAEKGSKSKLLKRELNYFIKNQERLSYKEVAAAKKPLHLLEGGGRRGDVAAESLLQKWALESAKKNGLRGWFTLCSLSR